MTVLAVRPEHEKDRKANEEKSKGWLEEILSSPAAPLVVTAVFLGLLILWSCFDNALPSHDAAWHSTYSNSVKQWLSRPRAWSLQTFSALLCMQPNYPAAAWFFNGFCKIFLGDSLWSEHFILAIHLCILNASTWLLANALLKDRMKATLTLIFLDSSPLILCLQHVPFIDLPHTAFYAAYLCALTHWWQNRKWKNAILTGLLFGFDCASKQIAILYSVPILALMGLILLYQRQFKSLLQLSTIGLCGAAFLSTWVIPNYTQLTQYTHNRSALATERVGFIQGVCRNAQLTLNLIWQSFSPLMTALLALSVFKANKQNFKDLWIPLFAAGMGTILIICVAFFNLPEARYFGPVILAFSMILACSLADYTRSARSLHGNLVNGTLLAVIFLCTAQAALLSFQKTPIITFSAQSKVSPVYAFLGITDPMINSKLSFVEKGDPWKQEWMFRFIEEAEGRGRPVYLNVLANCPEFNQGTLLCMARMRKPCVFPTTWRCSMPDVSDSFRCTDNELHFMQWVAFKTGPQYCRWFDETSRANYEEVIGKLQKNSMFTEAARQLLPDGTELILYQNNFWKFNRNSIVSPATAGTKATGQNGRSVQQ